MEAIRVGGNDSPPAGQMQDGACILKMPREVEHGSLAHSGTSQAALAQAGPAAPEQPDPQIMQGDLTDHTISGFLSQGLKPPGGWSKWLKINGKYLRHLARTDEQRRLRLSCSSPEAVTVEMLQTLFRQQLFAHLVKQQELPALTNIGRLLEKLPGTAAAPQQTADDAAERLAQLCRSTELLIERVRDSEGLLGAARVTASEQRRPVLLEQEALPQADASGEPL